MANDLMVEVDESGYADFSDLAQWWETYQKLLVEAAEIEAKIKAVKTRFGDRMKKAGATGFKINGVPVVSYKKDATFPVAEYMKQNPHVAAQYMTQKLVFDTQTFKAHRPDEYAQWQGHSFKLVKNS